MHPVRPLSLGPQAKAPLAQLCSKPSRHSCPPDLTSSPVGTDGPLAGGRRASGQQPICVGGLLCAFLLSPFKL